MASAQARHRVVIIPGTGQTPVKACAWYEWVATELQTRGVDVVLPSPGMPDPYQSRQQFWLPHILGELKVDRQTVLVGHSTGGDAVLRCLETTPALGAVLVSAGPSPEDLALCARGEQGMGYYDRSWDWGKIRGNCSWLVQLHHTQDSCISVEVAREIAGHLEGDNTEYVELGPAECGSAGHFMEESFGLLVDIIMDKLDVSSVVACSDQGAAAPENQLCAEPVYGPGQALQLLPAVLPAGEPYIFLSARQRVKCNQVKQLRAYVDQLPCWVPQRVVCLALGFDFTGIETALSTLAPDRGPFVWATEFENVHTMWRFTEPSVTVCGKQYACSEQAYHAQKPKPFDDNAWGARRVDVMREAVRSKFQAKGASGDSLRALLLSTHPHPLLSIKGDTFWGFDPKKGGQNMLAVLLMELREARPLKLQV